MSTFFCKFPLIISVKSICWTEKSKIQIGNQQGAVKLCTSEKQIQNKEKQSKINI